MKTRRILAAILAVTMIFGASIQAVAAETAPASKNQEPITLSQTGPTLLTNEQLLELMESAPDLAETRSAATLANRRIIETELTAWVKEYWELGINAFELEMVRLINIERENHNLNPLAINPNLMMAARFHSHEMADLRYFNHRSPHHGRGISRAEMFGHENIQDHVWGVRENIAGSTRSPQSVVQAWMNSPGHRAAILGETYLTIGIGAVQGGGTTAKFGS
jgi:uncharacterized protein YkwD